MGGSEILLILLAVLVLFGADKLPDFARSLGKGIREVKKATDEIKEELTKESIKVKDEITSANPQNRLFDDADIIAKDVNKDINEAVK